MRGKAARELRKVSGFHPHDKREYQTWNIGTKKYLIYRILPKGGVDTVEKELDCYVRECVSKPRKIYKDLKSNYLKFKKGEEVQLNYRKFLPEDKLMEALNQED